MKKSDKVSTKFPYKSHYINLLDSKLHYIEEGAGDPILFLHGIPTSSYLWRNVIPHAQSYGRCIAPDLIGMGKSGRPNIEYNISDHIQYVEAFIETLGLKNITLVMHGWGSIIGFDYAMRHEENIKSLVFLEAHLKPEEDPTNTPLPLLHLSTDLSVLNQKQFNARETVNRLLQSAVLRPLKRKELKAYRKPFSKKHYRPISQYIAELSIHPEQSGMQSLINDYSKRLSDSSIPKLMFYAIPGFNTTVDTIQWAMSHLKNLHAVDLGEDLHFVQETKPDLIGLHLADWLKTL